jgi:hypothetical protein
MNSTITPAKFDALLPLACQWAAEQEERILTTGEPLSAPQMADAHLVGVAHADRVRLLPCRRFCLLPTLSSDRQQKLRS